MWYAAACRATGAMRDRSYDPKRLKGEVSETVGPLEVEPVTLATLVMPGTSPDWQNLAGILSSEGFMSDLVNGTVEFTENNDENRVLRILRLAAQSKPDIVAEAADFPTTAATRLLQFVQEHLYDENGFTDEERLAFNSFYESVYHP